MGCNDTISSFVIQRFQNGFSYCPAYLWFGTGAEFIDQDEALRGKIAAAIEKVNTGNGVILLTDMFGGTPSNISLSFLSEGKVEVVTGANLPMLIGLASKREGSSLNQVAREIKDYALRSIALAGEILKKEIK
jgi:PTS system mannose-specific IIA component